MKVFPFVMKKYKYVAKYLRILQNSSTFAPQIYRKFCKYTSFSVINKIILWKQKV